MGHLLVEQRGIPGFKHYQTSVQAECEISKPNEYNCVENESTAEKLVRKKTQIVIHFF